MWDLTIDGVHDFYVSTSTSTVLVHNNSCGMLGENGTQTVSKTLYDSPPNAKNTIRIDVENPNPGVRAGQLHLQHSGGKSIYDFATGEFPDLPNSILKQISNNPGVLRAIQTGAKYLGVP